MTHPSLRHVPTFLIVVAEFGFFVLAYIALAFAFADFVDGVGGYQVEAVVAAIAAGSGVLVDCLESVRKRRRAEAYAYHPSVWGRGEGRS